MFRKEKPITLKASASSLCNNLALHLMPEKRQIGYAVVHKSMVNIACATPDGSVVTGRQVICKEPSVTQGLPFVLQAKWVTLPSRSVLVLTSSRGIQVFESDGSAMVYWHSLSDSPDVGHCAKGIAGVGENFLCIGTDDGSILVFSLPVKGTNIKLEHTLTGHKAPISDLASEQNTLVSADDMGCIIVWKLNGGDFDQVSNIKANGWPCNSVAIWKGVIVAGFASGHLRVYNATTGCLGAEVTAHARTINAVDISTDTGMVISASDDTFFRIWQLKPLNAPQIEFRHSECVPDLQLVGAKFIDEKGGALCVTGYDSSDILFFVRT
ncbi:WD repeat-containing protein 54-like [Physella acuta]|uniref:WD repeat-containing protein 54-like n=1 Tax=Physella acuta TaxID=109671 RepID=UPI0027DC1653|nr:WD repeat-containing protein 54-like [Physella acuta]